MVRTGNDCVLLWTTFKEELLRMQAVYEDTQTRMEMVNIFLIYCSEYSSTQSTNENFLHHKEPSQAAITKEKVRAT